jgi:hypothetical protein
VLLNLILPEHEIIPKDQAPEPTDIDIEAQRVSEQATDKRDAVSVSSSAEKKGKEHSE